VSLGTIFGDEGFRVHLIGRSAVWFWDIYMYKNYKYGVGFLTLLPLALSLSVSRVGAQVVPTAIDGTVVNQTGNQFGIVGGQVSGDGTNLFHSLDRFGLSQGQVAQISPVGSLLSVEVPLTVGGQTNERQLPVGSLPPLFPEA
jgi:hypothetical protein